MDTRGWLSLSELQKRTGRRANSFRRHKVEEWSYDGLAVKTEAGWRVNPMVLKGLPTQTVWRTAKEHTVPNQPQKEAGDPLVSGPDGAPIGYAMMDGVRFVRVPEVDELGFQIVHVNPDAKFLKIVGHLSASVIAVNAEIKNKA